MNSANKLACIQYGDTITYHGDGGRRCSAIVTGWHLASSGRHNVLTSTCEIALERIIERRRTAGCGKGIIVFEEERNDHNTSKAG